MRLIIIATLSLLAATCGQKGPLEMPAPESAVAAAPVLIDIPGR